MNPTIYVTGHRHPDTDSICAAITYADLLNRCKEPAQACRQGPLNEETKFVLKRFHQENPLLLTDARTMVKDIDIFSYCEHHMALMYDMKVSVAYIPRGRVIGLSKIARVCDMVGKRLQLQERLGRDIAEIISEAAGTPDVGVMIRGCHSCMTARGIKNVSANTVTATYIGAFRDNAELKQLVKFD